MTGFGVYQSPFSPVIRLLTSRCLLDQRALHEPRCGTRLVCEGSPAETSRETWDIAGVCVFLLPALMREMGMFMGIQQ